MRLHIELSRTFDPCSWQEQHAEGLVPGRLPYGLDELEHLGFDLAVRGGRGPIAVDQLDAVARHATGLQLFHALRDRTDRRSSELAVCWDERTGIPAALRSRLRHEPPTAFGAIWLTESEESLPALGRALARRALDQAAAIWTLSPAQLPVLMNQWGVDERRLHFVRMGIDAKFWHVTGAGPEPGLVVGAGNDRHRDHALLVEAMSRLHHHRPTVRLELVTQSHIAVPPQLGARHHYLSHVEMRALYTRAEVVAVVVKPNLHVSGMSVLLEAMACGRPVVATDTPGMAEYVADGETGLLVPPGDADALAAALTSLLAEPDRAQELGQAGRRAVESDLTTSKLASRLADVFRAAAGP